MGAVALARCSPVRAAATAAPPARGVTPSDEHPARLGARRWALLLALGLAAGCAGPAIPPRPDALIPGPSGLAVAGTGLEIGFGRAQAGAVAAASRLLGPPSGRRPCEEGPGEVVRWPSGLALHFPAGTLAGWESGGRSTGRLCRAPG